MAAVPSRSRAESYGLPALALFKSARVMAQ